MGTRDLAADAIKNAMKTGSSSIRSAESLLAIALLLSVVVDKGIDGRP